MGYGDEYRFGFGLGGWCGGCGVGFYFCCFCCDDCGYFVGDGGVFGFFVCFVVVLGGILE